MADKINDDTRQALECFARNGRWGTCVDCPRTSIGDVFPEFCRETERYDHHLDFDAIIFQVRRSQ